MSQEKTASILCDTNILIYYMNGTPRFIKDVVTLFERCAEYGVGIACASLSLKDVFYITPARFKDDFIDDESVVVATTAKLMLPEVAWSSIARLRTLMKIVPVGADECALAQSLRSSHNDFEDNLIVAAAKNSGAEHVVTYDKKLAQHYPGYCLTPANLISQLEQN